uniref:Uncharacterized protein n=1 Tax=Strongyloides papillosus TaxID=174720 RepID=A0A0N5BI73_STREA
MSSTTVNRNSKKTKKTSTSGTKFDLEEIVAEVTKIKEQLKIMEKDFLAAEKLAKSTEPQCLKKVLSENKDITNVLTSTRIIRIILASSSPLSMSALAGLLIYVQPMISSSYIESQDVAVTFLGVIKDLYWDEIVKTCGMPVNSSMKIKEKNRIKNAQKARDLLVNVATNATAARISSNTSACTFKTCVNTFITF